MMETAIVVINGDKNLGPAAAAAGSVDRLR